MAITSTHLYTGMADYWGGDGNRWDDNKGCLFARYGARTTLKDIVESWVDDFNNGGDCESLSEDITALDIKEAILGMLSGAGLADYHGDKVAECATEYADANELHVCECCKAKLGCNHKSDCDYIADLDEDDEFDV